MLPQLYVVMNDGGDPVPVSLDEGKEIVAAKRGRWHPHKPIARLYAEAREEASQSGDEGPPPNLPPAPPQDSVGGQAPPPRPRPRPSRSG